MMRGSNGVAAAWAVLGIVVLGCGGGADPNPGTGGVVLNEVDCHGRDWVEVVNRSAAAVDLSGWSVADDPAREGHQYALPAGSVVQAGGRLVVKQAEEPDPGFPFGIKCAKDTIYLVDAGGAVADQVAVGDAPSGSTWGRLPDATGTWQETWPTQGAVNHGPSSVSGALFDPLAVSQVAITLPAESVASLKVAPYTYTQGQVQVTLRDGTTAVSAGGVRLKSGVSFQPLTGKASFRWSFDEFDSTNRLMDLKGLVLNAMVQDASMMHETLAYRIFREAGIPAPRTGYAWVTVNGEPYGLYVVVEIYDDLFADDRFDSTQHVYEGTADLYATEVAGFDVDVGDKDLRTDLEALIATIQGTGDDAWLAATATRMDVEGFVRLWAIENFIGQEDGYVQAANNYFLHSTDESVFTMMPWGADRAFTATPAFPTCGRVLCTRCLAVPACAAKFAPAVKTLAGTVAAMGLDAVVSGISQAIASYVGEDPRKPVSLAEHQAAVQSLRSWLSARQAAATAAGAP